MQRKERGYEKTMKQAEKTTMRLAVIGFGGVGKALIRLLEDKKETLAGDGLEIRVNYILEYYGGIYNSGGIDLPELIDFMAKEKDITKFPGGGPQVTLETALAAGDVDLAVIMTPTNKETGEPGLSFIRSLLAAGVHTVTSDKGPVLVAYNELAALAREHGVQLGIGCTTGGALPSVNGGMMDMAGADILSIEGVLNGTTNFILKDMEENGVSYEEALKKAQECGIAETDPTLDVEGWDTATKLLILTNVHMGLSKTLKDVSVEGITRLTKEEVAAAAAEGKKYKLVGKTEKSEDGSLSMTVRLEKLGPDHLLYGVEGKNKAVRYTCDSLGDLVLIGGASGVTPAAASILRDIVNIHRGYRFVR